VVWDLNRGHITRLCQAFCPDCQAPLVTCNALREVDGLIKKVYLIAERFSKLLFILALLLVGSVYGDSTSIELYIPDAPPLTMTDEINRHGIIGDVVLRALTEAGYQPDVRTLPWARAQKYVGEHRDMLIIPLTRTSEREGNFTWIAPIMSMERAFFSLTYQVNDFEEAKALFRVVAVGLGSAQEEILRSNGFPEKQIYALKIGENPAQLLLMGRVDAWFNGIPESLYIWSKISNRKLFVSPPLAKQDLYLACSKICDPKIVLDLKRAVEKLRDDGFIEAVKKSYMGN
jgi:polar amino acid transport system substrate-binding protein